MVNSRSGAVRFPVGRGVGEGEHLHPGGQFDSQRDDGAPDLVLGEVVQRQVGQPGVLRESGSGPRRGPGAGAVVRGRRACPRVVLVANAVIRCPSTSVIRSCAPGCGRSLRTITRIPAGQPVRSSSPVSFGDPGTVADLAVGVVGRRPTLSPGSFPGRSRGLGGQGEPDRVATTVARSASPGVRGCRRRRRSRISTFRPGRLPARWPGSWWRAWRSDGDVVGGGVRAGVPGPQQRSPTVPRCRPGRGRRTPTAGGTRSPV